jgi:hypothetical protein
MTSHDIVIILVMTFPMYLFSIYPGIKASEYIDEKYSINESQKRGIMVGVTFLFALTLSTLLYYI